MEQVEEDMGTVDMSDYRRGCETVEDLTSEAEIELFKRDLEETGDTDSVACGADVDGAEVDGAYVGYLLYDTNVNVEIKVDGLPKADDQLNFPPAPVWELRRGSCGDGEVDNCSDARSKTYQLEAGVPYYVVVNGRLDSGGVQLQVTAEETVCDAGAAACENGVQTACNATGTDFSEAKCVGDCLSADTCAADTCENALPITLTPGADPVVLTGSRSAYSSTWDADGIDNCNIYEPGPGGPTANVDLYLSFEGLTAGQKLVLDAEASEGNMAFFIQPECNPTACTAAYAFDNASNNRMVHDVQEDGTLLIAVEALGNDLDREFNIKASLIN